MFTFYFNSAKTIPVHEVRATQYKYISPLLRVDILNDENPKSISLKNKLEDYIKKSIDQKKAIKISIYFKNPALNRRIYINEKEKYTPASIMKLITLIAFLKQAETDQNLLSKQLAFNKTSNSAGYNFPPLKDIEPGKTYTIDELLSYMVIYSSNDAKDLLTENIDPSYIDKTFQNLQLEPIKYENSEDFMDIYTYGSLFRTLYNASYLSDQMSEKALELLTNSSFHEGISASVPSSVHIAHKFGERNNLNTGEKQLHDCGIVYTKKTSYYLCVMTKGSSFNDLKQIIQNLSLLTYQEVLDWNGN